MDERDVESLRDWLARTQGLRGQVRVGPGRPGVGHMGAPLVVTVLIAAAPIAAAASRAIAAWLTQRRSDTTIELTTASGQHISVTNKGPTRAEDLLASIQDLLGEPPDDEAT